MLAWKFGTEWSYLAELALWTPPIIWFAVGTLAIGGSAQLLRRRRRLFWLMWPAFGAALLFAEFPIDVQPQRGTLRLRLMTYKMNWGTYRGIPDVAAAILSEAPDVVCLQEVSPHPPPHRDPVDLKRRLDAYNFVWEGEMMIASRYPILAHNRYELPGNFSSRPLLEIDIDLQGKTVRFLAAHLIYTHAFGFGPAGIGTMLKTRDAQLTAIENRIANSPFPVVLAGDLNFTPFHAAYRRLERSLSDAGQALLPRWNGTIPSGFPMRRLDHVFVSEGIFALNCRIGNANASDHEPLVMDLYVR